MSVAEEESSEGETVYLYRIPLEEDGGTSRPTYSPHVTGGLLMYHFGPNYLVIIQESGAGHMHKDSVNVQVEELDKEEVDNTDDLVSRYA